MYPLEGKEEKDLDNLWYLMEAYIQHRGKIFMGNASKSLANSKKTLKWCDSLSLTMLLFSSRYLLRREIQGLEVSLL